MLLVKLIHMVSVPLHYNEICAFLAVTGDGQVCVEELYSGGDWLAQHHLNIEGEFKETVDENYGQCELRQLSLPEDSITPQSVDHCTALDFSGPRLRGMREAEHLQELVAPLTIMEKMALIQHLGLGIPAMMLFGIAESRVLAEAALDDAGAFLVCRRLRLAVALPEIRYDNDNLPYDYETITLHLAHVYHPHDDNVSLFQQTLNHMGGVRLNQPMDCIRAGDMLFIADGGTADTPSRVHVWRILTNGGASSG